MPVRRCPAKGQAKAMTARNKTGNGFKKLAIVASDMPEAQKAAKALKARYDTVELEEADVLVALGGDGLMLQAAHRCMDSGTPIYGMHRGSVGFLMNDYEEDALLERLEQAELTQIHPLSMTAQDLEGNAYTALAVNEVSMLRETYQAAKLRISVDGKIRMEELICDGVLLSTPAGSTAYNLSAQGPILPLDSTLLALTPISPFRPRRWRGALLPNKARVDIDVLEPERRKVSAVADHTEFRDVTRVRIAEDSARTVLMLFDPGHSLDERILREQFTY